MNIPARSTVQPPQHLLALPKQRPGLVAYPVANELVVLSSQDDIAHALNETAALLWRLCDGRHSPLDMLDVLLARYDGDEIDMLAGVTQVLFQLQQLGLIELAVPGVQGIASGPRVRFVFGVEDKPYFYWQLAIFFESLVGQLPSGWDATVVVCNDHAALSPELEQLLVLHGARVLTGLNHARSYPIDFAAGNDGYVALNRVEALKAIAAHVHADDVVCLMDSDLFLYGDLKADIFPAGNALAANRVIHDRLFMGYGSEERGIDLQKLLGAIGCEKPLQRGGVTVFLTGATLNHPKLIQDCFRFAQILYLMGRVAGLPEHHIWVAEMACFALALGANSIEHALLDQPEFAVPLPQQQALEPGSFFHYYADTNDGFGGPFFGSEWSKHLFHDRDFLLEDLESFQVFARTDLERRFFDLAIAAKRRWHGEME